ncbi:hypothetical protein [Pelagicoccus mobilis]|uniref:Uncharacterized protein n=1 Tax=Pelagicoccus mobilis TaxID=415221 RepID=A0A934RTR4_9BACT|nr:hypothetical protein [Pelagicoccus mobilis]MBK1877450.1 hypothetical protein [Pelagicoccus mobilis]
MTSKEQLMGSVDFQIEVVPLGAGTKASVATKVPFSDIAGGITGYLEGLATVTVSCGKAIVVCGVSIISLQQQPTSPHLILSIKIKTIFGCEAESIEPAKHARDGARALSAFMGTKGWQRRDRNRDTRSFSILRMENIATKLTNKGNQSPKIIAGDFDAPRSQN